MSENNSYFELQPNLFHNASSSSSGFAHGSTAPEYTFPRRAPVFNMNQNYVNYKRSQWSRRAIAALVDWREIPDFRLQHIINSHWKLQGQVTVISQIRNFYILEFDNEQDWSFMLLNGPWLIKNSLLMGLFYPLSDGNKIWVSAMPERTFRLCEQCGRIGHLSKDCNWGLFKTYWELHQQQMTLCQNNTTYLWVDPQYVHFQCPKRKTSKWHFRESTKIQVQYDQYGPRYEVYDEFPPSINNIIHADWSSDSSADSQEHLQYDGPHTHQMQNLNASPENGSSPSVGNNMTLHGGEDVSSDHIQKSDHIQNGTISENDQNQNNLPFNDGQVAELAENFTPTESNYEPGAKALNDMDNDDPQAAAGIDTTDGVLSDMPQSLEDLLCHENPEDFDGDDEVNGEESLDQDLTLSDENMETDGPNEDLQMDGPMDLNSVRAKNKDTFHIPDHSVDFMDVDEGLALVLTSAGGGEIKWDVCVMDLQNGPMLLYINKFLLSIPGASGPFLISPTNWYFNFNIWNFQIHQSVLQQSYLQYGPRNSEKDDDNDTQVIMAYKQKLTEVSVTSHKRYKVPQHDSTANSSAQTHKRKRVTFDDQVNFKENALSYTKRFRLSHPKKSGKISEKAVPDQPARRDQ
ncbi:reverse transcriptase [Senna tora]|uniref:Reverse transcriptase n=1 Tax=Senna tora TaxID=362788 RepID=A0A834WIT8_9FABA|nr:reverse transcriptase [Senna tora]